MCRFLAYAGAKAESVGELLSPEELARFRRLSRLHRDGWGMAWLGEDSGAPEAGVGPGIVEHVGRLRAARSIRPAHEDPAFEALVQRRLGRAGFVHLRWATSGLAVAPANTHPFLASGWVFAHQGSIPAPERLEALLAPGRPGQPKGTTDSERYFFYVLQCLERSGSVTAAVEHAVGDIVAACGPTSLNAVLLSESSLVVVHGCSGLEPPREDLLAAMPEADEMPPDHLEGYFGLWYRRGPEAVVVGSSGFAGREWEPVPDDTIVHVDLADRAVSFTSFEGALTRP